MRVLVCRPESDAGETARQLRGLGHEAVTAPLTAIVDIKTALPDGPFDAIAVTSANAVRALGKLKANVAGTPLFAVGAKTAEAARRCGFTTVTHADGDAGRLAAHLANTLASRSRVLFLAGVERKPDLETILAQAGLQLAVIETYRAEPAAALPPPVAAALADGTIDAVLHYSRRGAMTFCSLLGAAGLSAKIAGLTHCCLSADVSGPLIAMGAPDIQIAAQPNGASLLATLPPRPCGRAGVSNGRPVTYRWREAREELQHGE